MPEPRLDTLLARLAQTSPIWWGIWFGLMLITVALLTLMRTRWGQSQPLRKCIALSLLAHLLMAGYATTVQIVHATIGPPREPAIRISAVNLEPSPESSPEQSAPEKVWETFAETPVEPIAKPEVDRAVHDSLADESPAEPTAEPLPIAPSSAADTEAVAPVEPDRELAETDTAPRERSNSPESATPLNDAPAAQRAAPNELTITPADKLSRPEQATTEPAAPTDDSLSPAVLATPTASLPPAVAAQANPDPASILADVNDRLGRQSSPLEALSATGLAATAAIAADAANNPSPAQPERFSPPQLPDAQSVAGPSNASLGDAMLAPAIAGAPLLAPVRQPPGSGQVPEIYRGRIEREQGRHDAASGATAETEMAVQSALRWLAANQSADGRWDAEKFGAGTERREIGPKGLPQDRQRAGTKADTGVSGLALLAFLGAGNTHLAGDHRETVRRGLDFLLASQRPDGNLGGDATTYAFMYCHGMATFALSEAYAMSGDRRLSLPLRRAIGYTLAAQHPSTGGWRYRPGELGDMSQLGWQLMALKSASLAGVDVPQIALDRAAKYIRSVSFGTHGGLASYRPGEQGSRTMTAEALASRQFLGLAGENPATREAANYILGELPGSSRPNLYYWYYGSLAMHNVQGANWDTWNHALRTELLSTQEANGPLAGTWPTDSQWSGYGGRVYTAAMGALCLEVYYRYLPIYLEASAKGTKVR